MRHLLYDVDGVEGAVELIGRQSVRDHDGSVVLEALEETRHCRLAVGVHVLHHLVEDHVAAVQPEASAREVGKRKREGEAQSAPFAARQLRNRAHAVGAVGAPPAV